MEKRKSKCTKLKMSRCDGGGKITNFRLFLKYLFYNIKIKYSNLKHQTLKFSLGRAVLGNDSEVWNLKLGTREETEHLKKKNT